MYEVFESREHQLNPHSRQTMSHFTDSKVKTIDNGATVLLTVVQLSTVMHKASQDLSTEMFKGVHSFLESKDFSPLKGEELEDWLELTKRNVWEIILPI